MIRNQGPMEEEEEELVGFRFHPTSYELVNHHLKRKLQKIDEKRCVIPDVNIYDYDPCDLCNVYQKSYKRSTTPDCFFFCPRNRVNPNSARNKRQARGGFWKETSTKQDVEDEETGKTIGTKRILVFCTGKQGNDEQKTEYAMHEYHLNADSADSIIIHPMAFSVCHVKKKKARSKKGNTKKRQIKNKGDPKKQQSKKVATSPCGEAGSSSPENLQDSSQNMEEGEIPTELQADVRVFPSEQLQMSGKLAIGNSSFSTEHCTESGLEILGSQGASADFSFCGQAAAELRTPEQIELPNLEHSDSTAGAPFEKEGNAADDDAGIGAYDDGLSLTDLGFLEQEWTRDLLFDM